MCLNPPTTRSCHSFPHHNSPAEPLSEAPPARRLLCSINLQKIKCVSRCSPSVSVFFSVPGVVRSPRQTSRSTI
jgi:hypothetical protein